MCRLVISLDWRMYPNWLKNWQKTFIIWIGHCKLFLQTLIRWTKKLCKRETCLLSELNFLKSKLTTTTSRQINSKNNLNKPKTLWNKNEKNIEEADRSTKNLKNVSSKAIFKPLHLPLHETPLLNNLKNASIVEDSTKQS